MSSIKMNLMPWLALSNLYGKKMMRKKFSFLTLFVVWFQSFCSLIISSCPLNTSLTRWHCSVFKVSFYFDMKNFAASACGRVEVMIQSRDDFCCLQIIIHGFPWSDYSLTQWLMFFRVFSHIKPFVCRLASKEDQRFLARCTFGFCVAIPHQYWWY